MFLPVITYLFSGIDLVYLPPILAADPAILNKQGKGCLYMEGMISVVEQSLKEKVMAMPSSERAASLARLGDVVWAVIRSQLTSPLLKSLGDGLWRVMKLDLKPRKRRRPMNPMRAKLKWN